jgi:hypothetical protein
MKDRTNQLAYRCPRLTFAEECAERNSEIGRNFPRQAFGSKRRQPENITKSPLTEFHFGAANAPQHY